VTPVLITETLQRILGDEGGLSNDSRDRGGLTNFGLTKPFLLAVTHRTWSDEDVAGLTRDVALSIYRLWMAMRRLDQLPEHPLLAWVVVDFAVHSGERRAIKAVQRALGIPADGIVGAETQGSWHRLGDDSLRTVAHKVLAERLELLGVMIEADHSQAAFASGWMHRCAAQVRACA
jgi:lysozyme family protein